MKSIGLGIISLVALSALPARAVDLEEASNRQLLNEVARRLNENIGNEDPDAFLSGICTSGNYLNLTVEEVASGATHSHQFYLGSSCRDQLASIRSRLGSFSGLRRVHLCSSGNYLQSVSARPSGITYTQTYAGSDCQAQANDLNGLE